MYTHARTRAHTHACTHTHAHMHAHTHNTHTTHTHTHNTQHTHTHTHNTTQHNTTQHNTTQHNTTHNTHTHAYTHTHTYIHTQQSPSASRVNLRALCSKCCSLLQESLLHPGDACFAGSQTGGADWHHSEWHPQGVHGEEHLHFPSGAFHENHWGHLWVHI